MHLLQIELDKLPVTWYGWVFYSIVMLSAFAGAHYVYCLYRDRVLLEFKTPEIQLGHEIDGRFYYGVDVIVHYRGGTVPVFFDEVYVWYKEGDRGILFRKSLGDGKKLDYETTPLKFDVNKMAMDDKISTQDIHGFALRTPRGKMYYSNMGLWADREKKAKSDLWWDKKRSKFNKFIKKWSIPSLPNNP